VSETETLKSRPTFCAFSPDVIPYQRRVLDLIRDFDYAEGTPEILLSGSYGSAKSTLMAHLAIRHCLKFPGARVAIGRRAMPDLKRTIWREILDHIAEDFIEGVHYRINRSSNTLTWKNGSEIISVSWADQLFAKFRSLKLSMLVVEEIVENDEDDQEAFRQLKARLRRLPDVKENVLIAASNPDAPSHWVYKYFIEGAAKYPTRFVFYSKTEDNPFIDRTYVRQLRQDLSPKEAQRYLDGLWIEISGEVIYYEYSRDRNYSTLPYTVDPLRPVVISFDFNIGHGKPLSCCLMQNVNGHFHVFAEVVIDGANTWNVMEELESRQLLRPEWNFVVCGDAAGKNRDTRSSRSDYEIITKFLSDRALRYTFAVPAANPPIRLRHNRVNAYCRNSLGESRLTVYSTAPTVDEGLRLVKLKEGGQYLEDDSKRYQHVTTALGYAIVFLSAQEARGASTSRQL